jgi:glutamate synthase (NADPH/NADH) small chain
VLAIGYQPDPEIVETTPGLELERSGCIKVESEATGRTTRPGVFAAGDNVRGADLVVTAIGAARKAAIAMDEYIRSLVS